MMLLLELAVSLIKDLRNVKETTEDRAGKVFLTNDPGSDRLTGSNCFCGLNASIILIFFYISWRTVAIVQGKASGLGWWFLPGLLGLTFAPIIMYMVQAGKKPIR